jgi:hypothetical protein
MPSAACNPCRIDRFSASRGRYRPISNYRGSLARAGIPHRPRHMESRCEYGTKWDAVSNRVTSCDFTARLEKAAVSRSSVRICSQCRSTAASRQRRLYAVCPPRQVWPP